jgi:protein-disulfide isomerase
MAKEAKIMILVFVVIFGGLGFLIVRNNQSATAPVAKDRIIRPTSHSAGNPNAKVNIVEFGDFQCPACAQAYPIVGQVLAQYKDNPEINFIFRNFPLPQHQYALITAEAAEAAGAQGKYFEMYDLLYTNQDTWVNSADPLTIFVSYATQLKLDTARFKSEVQANKYSAIINQDQADATALGINSTPTFYINGFKAVGIQSATDFKARIDSALAQP